MPVAVTLYLVGAASGAFGIYTISHRAFPAWNRGLLLWPLVTITPGVCVTQGWAAVLAGAACVGAGFAPYAPLSTAAPILTIAAACAFAALAFVVYGTWLSRRLPPESPRR